MPIPMTPAAGWARSPSPIQSSPQYHYENATYTNALTGITDESGIRYASFGYDASGKGILTQHANLAEKFTINYASSSAGATAITNLLGKNTTYNFINIGGVRKIAQVDGAASTNLRRLEPLL